MWFRVWVGGGDVDFLGRVRCYHVVVAVRIVGRPSLMKRRSFLKLAAAPTAALAGAAAYGRYVLLPPRRSRAAPGGAMQVH